MSIMIMNYVIKIRLRDKVRDKRRRQLLVQLSRGGSMSPNHMRKHVTKAIMLSNMVLSEPSFLTAVFPVKPPYSPPSQASKVNHV